MRRSTVLLLLGLLPATDASGQQLELTVREGFSPDPQRVTVQAGGDREVDECGYGFDSIERFVAVTYVGSGNSDLYFYVEGDNDTMLLVIDTGTQTLCDDDSHEGLNPLVHVPRAKAGIYGVFVGSFTSGTVSDATLFISSQNPGSGSGGEGRPDLSLEPTSGRASLSAPLSPDPHTVSLSAGGDVDVDVADCGYGYVARAPNYNVTYSGSGSTLYFFVRSDEDTTLLINKPDASWVCDDDSLGDSNPVVTLTSAPAGLYNIWVGTYSGDAASATLYISAKGAK